MVIFFLSFIIRIHIVIFFEVCTIIYLVQTTLLWRISCIAYRLIFKFWWSGCCISKAWILYTPWCPKIAYNIWINLSRWLNIWWHIWDIFGNLSTSVLVILRFLLKIYLDGTSGENKINNKCKWIISTSVAALFC